MILKKQIKIYKSETADEIRALIINDELVCYYTLDNSNKPDIVMNDDDNEEFRFLREICSYVDFDLYRVFYSHDNNVEELIRRGEVAC